MKEFVKIFHPSDEERIKRIEARMVESTVQTK